MVLYSYSIFVHVHNSFYKIAQDPSTPCLVYHIDTKYLDHSILESFSCLKLKNFVKKLRLLDYETIHPLSSLGFWYTSSMSTKAEDSSPMGSTPISLSTGLLNTDSKVCVSSGISFTFLTALGGSKDRASYDNNLFCIILLVNLCL